MKTALLILAICVAAPAIAAAQSPSLGDLGRQERTRQKNTKSNATFTNETLGTSAAEPAKPPSADKTGPDSAKGSATTPDVPRDETWWRDAFKNAREDVKRAEDRTRVLQLELNQLNMDLLRKSDLYNREGVLAPLIAAKNAELGAAEKEAEQARQKVMQLEDDLRRSGAPAGWAR